MNEKQWLEKSLINYFIQAMNNMHNCYYTTVSHRDRPDFIIREKLSNKNFGVEVTHLYYDSEEAKELFGRGHISIPKIETIEHYVCILNKLLNKKFEKANGYYQGYDLILLIGITSSLFDRNDFENSREGIIISESRYSYICLVFFNELNQNWEDLMFLK